MKQLIFIKKCSPRLDKISLLIILVLSGITGCAGAQKEKIQIKSSQNFFAEKRGCFLLYNMKSGTFDKVIGETCNERFPACSTFKVPLAIMAFDSGVLDDERVILKWDGKKDSRDESNRDHNAKTWMRDSIVWFSQRITPQLGARKLQKYLDDFNYGNRNISAGITTAWLTQLNAKNEGLKISAYEQVEFMKKLWTNSLPVSPKSLKLAREITYLETSPRGFRLSGKTGSNFYDEARRTHFGWFVAHLQNDNQEFIAVINFGDLKPTDENGYGGGRAKQIMKQILKDEGIW